MTTDQTHKTPGRALLAAVAALCLLGLGLSVELSRIHLLTHTDPDFRSICAVSEQVNCETVALSEYSVFAGLPMSLWGLLGYLVMGGFAIWGLTSKRLHPRWPWGILFALFVFSAATSAVMGFISATRIESVCLFCLATYSVNAVLLVLGFLGLRRVGAGPGRAFSEDLSALGRRPALFAGVAALGLGLVLAAELAVPAYWEKPGIDSLAALPSGVDAQGRHWIGAENPKVTLVEFSDYECPYCRVAHLQMRELLAKYGDSVRLIHRHFPLDQRCNPMVDRPFHRSACQLALAAECAGKQERFWAMNDAIFGRLTQGARAEELDPEALAAGLGLDAEALVTCMKTGGGAGRVNADVQEGLARGLNSTPSFFIDGTRVEGLVTEDELKKALQQAE